MGCQCRRPHTLPIMPVLGLSSFLSTPARKLVALWIFIFLALNLAVPQGGGDNANSRLAAIQSLLANGDYKINAFIDRTCDWSRTSMQQYYSNKAPGGMVLGYIVLGPTEWFLNKIGRYDLAKQGHELPSIGLRTFLCFLTQMLPLCLAVVLFSSLLLQQGSTNASILFLCLAVFLGNTAAIYMNTYFGHGLISSYALLGLYFLLRKRLWWTGFFCALALLSDYAFLAQIPAMLILFFLFLKIEKHNPSAVVPWLLLGAIVPLILWGQYHKACFGSALTLPQKFINPTFLDPHATTEGLRLFSLPSPMIPLALLFGLSRGILFTQPWVLVSIAFSILTLRDWTKPKQNESLFYTSVFCHLSFLGLLAMNATFYGWHGGMAAGPRYMSSIFPAYSVLVCLQYSQFSARWKTLVWLALGYSLFLRGMIYGTTILAPTQVSLFRFFFEHLRDGNIRNNGLRLFFYFALVIWGVLYTKRNFLRGLPATTKEARSKLA